MPRRTFIHLLGDEDGATMIEYGLVLALVSMGLAGSLSVLGVEISDIITVVQQRMDQVYQDMPKDSQQ